MSSSPTSRRNNTLVSESDLDAAYHAIEQRMQSSISKYGTSNPAKHRLLQECRGSLRHNIDRIVEPITDEAFSVYVTRHDDEEDATEKEVETPETEEESDDDDEDIEYDEEELVSPDALQRVQELRQQIRTQAASVQAIRNQVLDQAVEMGQSQVNLLLGRGIDDDPVPLEVDNTGHQEKVQEMQENLTNMVLALDKTKQEIPDKLEILQNLNAQVEDYLRKHKEGTLSQVDQTILRHDGDEEGVIDLMQDSSSSKRSPEDRLASFLERN